MMFPGGDEGSDGLGEKKRRDFLTGYFARLQRMQDFDVRCAAGTKGLHRQCVGIPLAQVMKQQAGEESFADAGVGASNEDDARLVRAIHGCVTALPTDKSQPSPFRSTRYTWPRRSHSATNSSGDAVLNSNRSK